MQAVHGNRSLAELTGSLSQSNPKVKELLDSLTEEEAIALQYDWRFWARPKQLPPEHDDWNVWALITGRGYGKTRSGSETVRMYAEQGLVSHIAIVAPTKADARETMIEGESGILACSPPWFRPTYQPSRRRIEWPNGVRATTYAAEEPDRLRGPQHGLAWCDELAAWKYPQDTWNNLMLGLRMEPSKAIVTTTPRPIPTLVKILESPHTITVSGSTYENIHNLTEAYREQIETYEGTRLGRQELYGEVLLDVEGALWTNEQLDNLRIDEKKLPQLRRIVVAIDPAMTNKSGSDETGIIVAGIGDCECMGKTQTHGFILDDLSGKSTPNDWATTALHAYQKWEADRIVAEVNNGGDMVERLIRSLLGGKRAPYQSVRATRGKMTRAEPVSALYEQGKVHHVGAFSRLEDQMTTFTQDERARPKGDDRVDALVWGLTELMIKRGNRLARAWRGKH